ncbi:metal ABC transporter solute-binding protein, Zn/Mn family [Leuconostoc citreum]|uniref:metal ABC transporter solute-binding protein, Zn/Mn family n=1 Tax=Leuconostoc citreum TaxID=33964 RepID=UPI001C1FA4F1|nr:zinc ABC transporter substrate-binding protein [Leuconostoc citreum]MBU7450744.1 zinc ABC transporter substrate-binding protein [Leuconostoc citreum]
MNRQAIYAILTILLIPLGLLWVFVYMTTDTPAPKHVPVKIVTDNVAYQQIAASVAGKGGQVTLVSANLPTKNQRQAFKSAEIILTDSHQDQLLTQRNKQQLHSKILVASDVVNDQGAGNYWLSPEIMLRTINRLSDLLSDFDPQNRDVYMHNSQKLLDNHQALSNGINTLKSKNNVQYIATNSAQQIFMSQLNYRRVLPNVETADDKAFDQISQDFKAKKIKFILTAPQDQSQNDQRLVKLAKDAKIPVITFNQVLPHDENILAWQFNFVTQINNAIQTIESGK